MKLAGRCLCGVIQEWVDRKPDEHLRCYGIKWCKHGCGALLPLESKCPCIYFKPANETEQARMKRKDRIKHRRKYAREQFIRQVVAA